MSRAPLRYKLLLELLLGILRKEMSEANYTAIIDLLTISYKLEVEKEWKKYSNSLKK